tara:strand:- start:162 stop:707 length:546 start_codon:yes stop_codon:yes gene_type:complete
MRIEFVGSGYELLVGKLTDEQGEKFSEIGDDLTADAISEIAGDWTELNHYVHFNGPDEDDCVMTVDGEETDPELAEPDDFDLSEMINNFGIKDDDTRFIAVTISRESGNFGCVDLPDGADIEKFRVVSQAPEYAEEEFCIFTHYFYDGSEVQLSEDTYSVETSSVKHIIYDIEEEEIVAEN